jgi:uncharacterized integral membrane protein (TIGR00697 family)
MPFFGLTLSVAAFSFPVVFLMTDVIGEVYGKKVAKFFVLAGFVATLLFIGYSFLSLALPWAPGFVESGRGQAIYDSYGPIFGTTIRIAIASIVAFLIAQYQDVLAFFFFKAKLGEKHFWLRSTLSNLWSQFLDTTVFMAIAFLGVLSWPVLISSTISWWLLKVAMGLVYTPLSYGAIWFLKDKNEGTADKN